MDKDNKPLGGKIDPSGRQTEQDDEQEPNITGQNRGSRQNVAATPDGETTSPDRADQAATEQT